MLTVADMMTTALTWHAAGYSVIPIKQNGSKQPDLTTWEEYQNTQPPEDSVADWGSRYAGMGVVCGGPMSLEMLEVEGYALFTAPTVKQLMADNGLTDVWARIMGGYMERSPRGGLHWFYRISDGPARGNTKLARRRDPDDPSKVQVLWETRGQGGQTVIAPSNGRTSRDGVWAVVRGTVADIPTITAEERDCIFAVLSMCDEMTAPSAPADATRPRAEGDGERPGDDFNTRAEWDDILTGWTKAKKMGNGFTWRRPGKTDPGISATTGQAKDGVDRLYVFSTSTEFESERPYSKFAAYTLLHHRGDWTAATRALRASGYGAPPPDVDGWLNSLPAAAAVTPDLEATIFGATPVLEHIRTAARSRLVAPTALLGAVLARCVAEVLPTVALPAIIGTRGSLNLFVALTGPSGAAKTTAAGVADDLLDIGGAFGPIARVQGTGSGEGLVASFLMPDPDNKGSYIIKDRPHVCMVIDEIGQIAALQNRQGASLAPILRSAWSGSSLDNINADPARRRIVPKMSYRLTAIAGVQPLAADVLFNDADTGTPQRWLWLPALDPDIPDTEPEWPGQIVWSAPEQRGVRDHHGLVTIVVPDHVRDSIRAAHRARNRGQDHELLDGHAALTRLKVAAALGILHGAYEVTDTWWDIAGHIMGISDRVRSDCQRAIAEQAERTMASRGRGDYARERGKVEAVAERAEKDARAVSSIVRIHASDDPGASRSHPQEAGCTPRCITIRLTRRSADQRAEAVAYALGMGWITTDLDGRHRVGPSQPTEEVR